MHNDRCLSNKCILVFQTMGLLIPPKAVLLKHCFPGFYLLSKPCSFLPSLIKHQLFTDLHFEVSGCVGYLNLTFVALQVTGLSAMFIISSYFLTKSNRAYVPLLGIFLWEMISGSA